MRLWKIDLHLHSVWSYDAYSSLDMIIRACRRRQLDALALTDHNELEGALHLQERAPFKVIAGEEISTTEGEIIGLFLKERIPPEMSLQETVQAIKEQGGIVYLPHPFETVRKGVSQQSLEALGIDQVDIWEGFNARTRDRQAVQDFWKYSDGRALKLAAGSDAHTPWELGRTYTLIQPFESPQELLIVFDQAEFVSIPVPFIYRLVLNHKMRRYLRRIVRRNLIRGIL